MDVRWRVRLETGEVSFLGLARQTGSSVAKAPALKLSVLRKAWRMQQSPRKLILRVTLMVPLTQPCAIQNT